MAGFSLHAPVSPIPDNDWEGETWGLYWPDIERDMEENMEDPCKYISKHYEKKREAGDKERPPPDQVAQILPSVQVLLCPR